MSNVWAPWRIEYILAPKDGSCFLCDYFAAGDDAANRILARGPTCAVVMNRFPYTGGHLMIAPFRHIDDVTLLTADERAETMDWTARCTDILRRVMKAQGFNVGYNLGVAAGAGLKDHLHLHIVPRWVGDTNFMPVLGGTHVVPQALDELYARLLPEFE